MYMNKKEASFRNKFHVGGRIRIKHLHELNDEDAYNVTSESIGKDAYLGRTLTVSDWMKTAGDNRWCCLVEEDHGSYCWFDSMIVQDGRVQPTKTNTLPSI